MLSICEFTYCCSQRLCSVCGNSHSVIFNVWGSKSFSAFAKWTVLTEGEKHRSSRIQSQSCFLFPVWVPHFGTDEETEVLCLLTEWPQKAIAVIQRIIFPEKTDHYISFACIVIFHNSFPCSFCLFVSCVSVPEFVVAQPNCPCKEEQIGLICRIQRCSIKAWGEVYAFEFLEDHTLLSSSFVINQVVNSSFSLIKRFSGNCFAGGNLLAPPGAECRVTYCEGQLVSMHWAYQLFCKHLQPLQACSLKPQTYVNHPFSKSEQRRNRKDMAHGSPL